MSKLKVLPTNVDIGTEQARLSLIVSSEPSHPGVISAEVLSCLMNKILY